MCYAIGMSVSSLHRESTDSLISSYQYSPHIVCLWHVDGTLLAHIFSFLNPLLVRKDVHVQHCSHTA